MMRLREKLLRILTGRVFINALNVLMLVIAIRIFLASFPLIFDYTHDTSEQLERLLDGVDTPLVGYGVLLEERGFIMRSSKLYPRFENAREKLTDLACEHYGIILLLLGLFMELPSKEISLPNDILNTLFLESGLYAIAVFLILVSMIVLAIFIYRLVMLELRQRTQLDQELESIHHEK